MDRDKAALIASAEIRTHRWGDGRCVSGHAQKAVLWTLWAFEGQRMSIEAISDRAGVSVGQGWRAIWALINQGVVIPSEASRQQARWYQLDPRRLLELRCETALVRPRKARKRRFVQPRLTDGRFAA